MGLVDGHADEVHGYHASSYMNSLFDTGSYCQIPRGGVI